MILARWLIRWIDQEAARQIEDLRQRLNSQKEATRRAEWAALTSRDLAERWRSIALGDNNAETE